jgi:hypothetical protein
LFSGLIGARPQTRRSPILILQDIFNLLISPQLSKLQMKRTMREAMSSLMINHLRMIMRKRPKEIQPKKNQRHPK